MATSIEDVKAKYVDELMSIDGVTSVGIGKNSSGDIAIIIGLKAASSLVIDRLPQQLDGYPVSTHVTGSITAQ